jgi:1-pyrroline-5-carboxylate dehydrogenase
MSEKFRVTYATLAGDPNMHTDFEQGVADARAWLDAKHPFYVNGEARQRDDFHTEFSPSDSEVVIGHFAKATRDDVQEAIAAAKAYAPEWDRMGYAKRAEILERAADLMEERRYMISALMAMEVGKNRLEAIGDVQESADLIRWNAQAMVNAEGFRVPMQPLGEAGDYYDIMRPYGVWAVISPFNFPMALAAGPSSAALAAGNTVVCKPASQGAAVAHTLYEIYRDAGVPPAAFQLITGSGSVVGDEIVNHPDVEGVTFTGSYDVGMKIYREFSKDFPKPVICEMGGKNPAVVTKNADLDKASDGVYRSAFGLQGQKCSANSRVYVEREVYDEFVAKLKEKTEAIVLGDPLEKDVYMGPVIDKAAVATFEEAVAEAKASGEIVAGGEVLTEGDLGRGNFVQPTVVAVPRDSWLWKRELFVPFVAVSPVDSLDEGLQLANDTEYGLTAGFYSEDDAEVDRFCNEIHAGVIYINRRAGATTGAWPGVQPFGGWKGSGTTGPAAGGPYYVLQYMREQSRTVIG